MFNLLGDPDALQATLTRLIEREENDLYDDSDDDAAVDEDGDGVPDKQGLFKNRDDDAPSPADLLRALLELELRLDNMQRDLVAGQTQRAGVGSVPNARGKHHSIKSMCE